MGLAISLRGEGPADLPAGLSFKAAYDDQNGDDDPSGVDSLIHYGYTI